MPPLAELQRGFAGALLDPSRDMPQGIMGPDGEPAARRFNVYRNNVIVSLSEALAATYPAVQRLLGEAYFRALAAEYIRAHPPRSPVLLFYGSAFADFLESFPPLAAYPYLGDVARIEWAWLQAYHAADAEPLAPESLATIAPRNLAALRFVPHPAACVLRSAHPALTIFSRNRDEEHRTGDGAETARAGEDTLVTRPVWDVQVCALPPGGAAFLGALFGGARLGEAAAEGERAATQVSEAFDLAINIGGMLEVGVFQGLA
ncbi:DNA-binding domain-containing protein [Breoghania sp. L-A4]|uniref:HvfC/BufC N-terminal domain-containing protein n=1 Tax=Breoghania sp. L-A4 TaxID=2304600 RepID=UPI000E35F43E|nr:DNA-binding domain-containing protein [Breoghania sp. L-A4]AXS41868.1 DUF2063 domain-containing protein [Breoghania sp. L-A4]